MLPSVLRYNELHFRDVCLTLALVEVVRACVRVSVGVCTRARAELRLSAWCVWFVVCGVWCVVCGMVEVSVAFGCVVYGKRFW